MFIIKYRKIFFVISTLLILGSIASMFAYGLNFGIDFKGGSVLEVSYDSRPDLEAMYANLESLNLGTHTVTPAGDFNYIIKTRDITPAEKSSILESLSFGQIVDGTMVLSIPQEENFTSIGPTVGDQLKTKALIAILIVTLCIVLFITFAFRKVSRPVASWKYGFATIVALAHDVIIPTGVFVAWTHFHGGEIDLLFVTALLAILGYSVHDSIVVFDRVRENLRTHNDKDSFEKTVGVSVSQTFGRSINTSVTIFLALAALYFIGGESTKDFALVLLIGVIAGTYSSIFVASPLLVTLEKLQKK